MTHRVGMLILLSVAGAAMSRATGGFQNPVHLDPNQTLVAAVFTAMTRGSRKAAGSAVRALL